MLCRSSCVVGACLVMAGAVQATPYNLAGTWVEVDYWASDGSPSPEFETVVVIDWNNTNGPYLTEAHAWGYRWSGNEMVLDALQAIDAAGPLDLEFGYGGAFLMHATYNNPLIDTDQHRTTGWGGWCYLAGSADGGQTWQPNGGGVDTEPLGHGQFEGINFNPGAWTFSNFDIPAPEPASLVLLFAGGFLGLRRRSSPR